jgi:hypothetical protein
LLGVKHVRRANNFGGSNKFWGNDFWGVNICCGPNLWGVSPPPPTFKKMIIWTTTPANFKGLKQKMKNA